MLQMMMAGRVYEGKDFKTAMDSNYFPLDNMKTSVEKLANSPNIDIATMEFGQYQPILSPGQVNPNGPKEWLKHVGSARVSLTAQANTKPFSKDEPNVIPLDQMRADGRFCSQVLQFESAHLHAGQCHAEGKGRSGCRQA